MKEKVEKSKLKGMEEELQNTALAPRNTFTSKYCDRCFCHDFVTPNTAEFRLFLVRAFSDDFEHALQKKVPKMLCQYPRKQFRANEDTENSNLKTSLNMQPETAISQCCSVKKWQKIAAKRSWFWGRKSRTVPVESISTQVPLQRHGKPGQTPKSLFFP